MSRFSNLLTHITGRVGTIQLNRPAARNALNVELLQELNIALGEMDSDKNIGTILLTGSDKVFSTGADISEIKDISHQDIYRRQILQNFVRINQIKTPIISVVRGIAFGGGTELAMASDIIYAGESARFGQPEICIGVIPGGGATQRLCQAIGKSRAMEYILTGRPFTATEAANWGLISSVHPDDDVIKVAMDTATLIASKSKPIIHLAKEAINQSYEMSLQAGLQYENRLFEFACATQDRTEGMKAFMEKRPPIWSHQ